VHKSLFTSSSCVQGDRLALISSSHKDESTAVSWLLVILHQMESQSTASLAQSVRQKKTTMGTKMAGQAVRTSALEATRLGKGSR